MTAPNLLQFFAPALILRTILAIRAVLDHDVDFAVQLVEHDVDVVEHGVAVVGIVEVGVALGGGGRDDACTGAAQRNGRRGRRVAGRGRRRGRRLWQVVAVERTLLYRAGILVRERDLVDGVDRGV
jgi:hypothetical protein